jgi:hypothetical protein
LLACAFLATACGSSTRDLHRVDWADVSLPGSVCGATHAIQLHSRRAVVDSSRWQAVPRVTVNAAWNPVVYGDLDGDGHDEAALVVDCSNGGGTADGVLAYAQVIFTPAGKSLRVVDVLTPQQPSKPNRLPTVLTVEILRGKVIAREAWYGPHDGTCCPSGRTMTIWTYRNRALRAGTPKVERSPSR